MKSAVLVGLGLTCLVACGCNPMTVGKEAYKVVRGAQADATPIDTGGMTRLAEYRSIVVGEVTTDVPPICTREVLTKVSDVMRDQLADKEAKEVFPGGDPTLKANVQCRFFKERGVIGGEGRLDWMVTLIDSASGDDLGTVFVEGVSASPLQHGITDMSKENTKELLKFLKKRKGGQK